MDEFNFDDDVTFSTNINLIKNNNNMNNNMNNNYGNNNINNKSHYIDEILNYNEDSYKANNFLSDKDIFPCESNKCKKYTLETMTQASSHQLKSNKNKIIKTKKKINNDKNDKNNSKYYIVIIILFILFNNYELCLYLQNKGFSYYKSLIFRLVGFLLLFYLIDKYIYP